MSLDDAMREVAEARERTGELERKDRDTMAAWREQVQSVWDDVVRRLAEAGNPGIAEYRCEARSLTQRLRPRRMAGWLFGVPANVTYVLTPDARFYRYIPPGAKLSENRVLDEGDIRDVFQHSESAHGAAALHRDTYPAHLLDPKDITRRAAVFLGDLLRS
jgi:hypothetical protein